MSKMFSLENRVALVTGASRGLGLAMAKALKENGIRNLHVEGMPNCDWVLIDSGDVIVHVFRPEVREFYNLERLWTQNPAAAKAIS